MIKIIRQKISEEELDEFLGKPFEDMVKFVADIKQGVLALGGELHADAEALLLEQGSRQDDLWGGNFYPMYRGPEQIEYSAMINIRPSLKNPSMTVQDEKIRARVQKIVQGFLPCK